MTRNNINPHAALEHLYLLGYKDGDLVHFGGFLDRKDPKFQKDQGRKASAILPKLPTALEKWANEKRSICAIANPGGTKNDEINEGRVHFFEYDDPNLSIEDQINMWKVLGLPEPTFQVITANKSVHNYYVLSKPHSDIKQWREVQANLVNFTDSDKALKNQNRQMRLPGYPHQKTGAIVKTINASGNQYTPEALRAGIPSPEQLEAESIPKRQYNQFPEVEQDELIRQALNYIPQRPGSSSGTYHMYRNVLWAVKSCCGEDRAIALLEAHSPSSECGWNIPQVARSGGQQVHLGTLFYWAKHYGFEFPKSNQKAMQRKATEQVSEEDSQSQVTLKEDVEQQLSQSFEDHPLAAILAPNLAKPLAELAGRHTIPEGVVSSALLCISGSLLKVGTCIRLPGGTDHTQPPILWVCIVGESGDGKSPAQRALLAPLDRLHSNSRQDWLEKDEYHQRAMLEWEASYNYFWCMS